MFSHLRGKSQIIVDATSWGIGGIRNQISVLCVPNSAGIESYTIDFLVLSEKKKNITCFCTRTRYFPYAYKVYQCSCFFSYVFYFSKILKFIFDLYKIITHVILFFTIILIGIFEKINYNMFRSF